MIYLDNIIFSLQRVGGISAVWSNLISNLLAQGANIRCLEFADAGTNLFRKNIDIPEESVIKNKRKATKLDELISPKICEEERFVFHSSYFRTCGNRNGINVTTVHDFIYEQGIPSLKEKMRIHLDYKGIRKSDAVVCVSENTKRDLLRFVPEIDEKNVYVIYNGVSDYFCKLASVPYPEYSDHILFVGGRQHYKNFRFTIEVVAESRYKLLICGAPLNESEKALLEKHLPGRYTTIHYPVNQELNGIYNSVFALAYPSSYEGFGIPVLEAQRSGCPVIALSRSSIPEIIGEEALLMPELTKTNFLKRIEDIENDQRRKEIAEAGITNSKRYTWSKMAAEYNNLYQQLIGHNGKSLC